MENTELSLKPAQSMQQGPAGVAVPGGSANKSCPQPTCGHGYRGVHRWHGLGGDTVSCAGRCGSPRGWTDVSSQIWLCWLKDVSLLAAGYCQPKQLSLVAVTGLVWILRAGGALPQAVLLAVPLGLQQKGVEEGAGQSLGCLGAAK